ncbi:hypothetical protein HYH03_000247 [Edaphochlamys debaryana]|uniref:Uncharacterized protein n=1 Tax=Edaphochlamys debaryana TaxID=47281 RepID=A0A836C7G1_9CHLO|nr:hypothetical protein HYH03_000247 [Edaphochlamys debaryana]|eukprot:KAG2501747.1 hypothetical protein HYH03_000247 [Edaphochlamys debaryana]
MQLGYSIQQPWLQGPTLGATFQHGPGACLPAPVLPQAPPAAPHSPTKPRDSVGLLLEAIRPDSTRPGPETPQHGELIAQALEAVADLARERAGALRLIELQGHVVIVQRLLAAMSALVASATSLPLDVSAADDPRCQQLQASVRCLTHMAMASPSHPDLRTARAHDALLHVMLAVGLTARTGVWALQGLVAVATDAQCAADLARAGLLPPLAEAIQGLAAAQAHRVSCASSSHLNAGDSQNSLRSVGSRNSRQQQSSTELHQYHAVLLHQSPAEAAASEAEVQLAHMLGLLLQNMAGHRATAKKAVEEGLVQAVCGWLCVCVPHYDVEGAVLCAAILCLLGDADQEALRHVVHADAPDALVDMLHPRWATCALVPATVAAAIAVSCRWGASAQAIRMAGGLPALVSTLAGAHGPACCRPIISALSGLIANDPPSVRDLRTTNTVIACGLLLQLLPNNDPRSGVVRTFLRQLGEDPDTAMRLAHTKSAEAAAAVAAVSLNLPLASPDEDRSVGGGRSSHGGDDIVGAVVAARAAARRAYGNTGLLAEMKSYKALRRTSLKQLAKRMDASEWEDLEDGVEVYLHAMEA